MRSRAESTDPTIAAGYPAEPRFGRTR
jgi:hypothetical protein